MKEKFDNFIQTLPLAIQYLIKHPALGLLIVGFVFTFAFLIIISFETGIRNNLSLWIDFFSGIGIPIMLFTITFNDENIENIGKKKKKKKKKKD